jgi:hypothetical protein
MLLFKKRDASNDYMHIRRQPCNPQQQKKKNAGQRGFAGIKPGCIFISVPAGNLPLRIACSFGYFSFKEKYLNKNISTIINVFPAISKKKRKLDILTFNENYYVIVFL